MVAGHKGTNSFRVTYRVGNGEEGNVRADTICHIISTDPILSVYAIAGGAGRTEPQALEDARVNAPYAFLAPQRAVTEDDYVRLVEQHPRSVHAARGYVGWAAGLLCSSTYSAQWEEH